MTSTYRFRLSADSDDAALRQFVAEVGLPGMMALTTRREPEFSRAEAVGNTNSQTVICEAADGRILGCLTRSIRRAYLGGKVSRVAYLNTIRIRPEMRGSAVLARGNKFVRELDASDPVDATIMTMYDDNHLARSVLTTGRAGLPHCQPNGALRTYAIDIRQSRRGSPQRSINGKQVGALVAATWLNQSNERCNYAPHWEPEDLSGVSGQAHGFDLEHLRFTPSGRGSYISAGVWDVSTAKQTVVANYGWPLSWYQPLSGLASTIGLGPFLPEPNQELRLLYGCCISGPANAAENFGQVLDDLIILWSGRGYHYLLIGLPAEHPYQDQSRRRARLTLKSTIYTVTWCSPSTAAINGRPSYVEIATL